METILWRFWRESPHNVDVWEWATVAVPPGDDARVSRIFLAPSVLILSVNALASIWGRVGGAVVYLLKDVVAENSFTKDQIK